MYFGILLTLIITSIAPIIAAEDVACLTDDGAPKQKLTASPPNNPASILPDLQLFGDEEVDPGLPGDLPAFPTNDSCPAENAPWTGSRVADLQRNLLALSLDKTPSITIVTDTVVVASAGDKPNPLLGREVTGGDATLALTKLGNGSTLVLSPGDSARVESRGGNPAGATVEQKIVG